MSERRPEPFVLALTELRGRLRRGEIPLDRRLAATEIAAELGLSATPVREALSRLAGEGLLDDRRGEGFFVRRLSRVDVVSLYRLSFVHLALAMELAGDHPPADQHPPTGDRVSDPVSWTERLFAQWAADSGSRSLALNFARLQTQLAAVRRLEPRLLEDLEGEAGELAAEVDHPPDRQRRLKAFISRRVRLAGRMAELLEQGAGAHSL